MADLDPQAVDAMNENMRRLAEAMEMNSALLTRVGKRGAIEQKDMDALGASVKKATQGLNELTEAEKAARKAEEEAAKAAYDMRSAFQSSVQGAKQLAAAFLDTEKNFKKYSSAISSVGDAAFSLGKAFGKYGAIIGGSIKGLTKVSEAYLIQADNVLKASDTIAKFSGAGSRTTSQLLDMAHATGLTSKNLELLTKPLSGLGQGLVSLGGSAGDGVTEFGKLTKILPETRAQYQRMGISQGDLIENQAQYIKLQQMSGLTLSKNEKSSAALQKASLQYTDNLLELAAVSGKNIDDIKKMQEVERTRYEIMIRNNLQQQEIIRLEKLGTEEAKNRAEQIKREMGARESFLDDLRATVGSEELNAAMSKFLSTGVVTKELTALKVQGVNIEKYAAQIKEGRDGKKVSDDFRKELVEKFDKFNLMAGRSLGFNQEIGKQLGLTKEMFQYVGAMRGKSPEEIRKIVQERQAKAKEEGTDKAQDIRAALTNAEIAAQVALDKLTKSTNPLLEGFNKNTVAALALYAAATAAAIALTKMASTAAMNAAGGLLGGKLPGTGGVVSPGGAAGAAGMMGKLGRGAMVAGRFAGGVGGAAIGGWMAGEALNSVYESMSGKLGGAGSLGSDLYSLFNKDPNMSGPAPARAAPKPTTSSPQPSDNVSTMPAPPAPVRVAPPVTAPAAVASTGGPGFMSEEEVKAMIKRHEGKRNSPYKDSEGYWTVGYGHLITKNPLLPAAWNRRFSDEEINKLFDEDYIDHRRAAERIPGWGKFNTKGQGALTDLTFNMGPDWWRQGPKLTKSLSEGDAKAAADNLEGWKWFRQVGIRGPTITGLLRQGGISAAEGGIASGPRSGYPATLHGTEVITPLEPNSILEKLAKTAATDDVTKPTNNIALENAMREMTSMHREMMAMFESKLDDMIAELETSNSTQDQLLKHSRA